MELIPFAVDLILAALFVIMIFDGRRKGFVKMALSLAAALIAFIIAKEYAEPAAKWVFESFFRSRMTDSIALSIASSTGNAVENINSVLPGYVNAMLETIGISVGDILANASGSLDAAQLAEIIVDKAIEPACSVLLYGLMLMIIFYVVRIIGSVAVSIIDKVFKLPVLKSINKLLGGVAGAIKGIFVVVALCIVATGAAALMPGTVVAQAVSNSVIVKLVCSDLGMFTAFQYLA